MRESTVNGSAPVPGVAKRRLEIGAYPRESYYASARADLNILSRSDGVTRVTWKTRILCYNILLDRGH